MPQVEWYDRHEPSCECLDVAHGDTSAGDPPELIDGADHAFGDIIPKAMGWSIVVVMGEDATICDLCAYAGHSGEPA